MINHREILLEIVTTGAIGWMEWIAETFSDMALVPGLCTTGSGGAEAPRRPHGPS